MADAPHPDFHVIFIDTNILNAEGWPEPSIALANVFKIANWWKIGIFLPEPVLKEAHEHWVRQVNDKISALGAAKRDLQRIASPAKCDVELKLTPTEVLIKQYEEKQNSAIKEYGIFCTPFTARTTEEIFGFATRYVLPFAHKGEGKGFQDAVILLSILDYMNSHPEAKSILITKDGDFKDPVFADFIPGFDKNRLRIERDLKAVSDSMWKPYIDEAMVKPYRQDVANALNAVRLLPLELIEFVGTHLTKDMLKGGLGETILKIISVDKVYPFSVELPFPKVGEDRDRNVEMRINVSATCSVLISRDFSLFSNLLRLTGYNASPDEVNVPPLPEESETQVTWNGGISATADFKDGAVTNIVLQGLLPEKQ
jgi:hypothetical protein